MRFTILGSGTLSPSLLRNPACNLLEIGKNKFLFDTGPGTIRRLLELKQNLLSIDHIFYTHLHNDHINDLGAIIWTNNYSPERTKPINLYGPKGLKSYFKIFLNKILKLKETSFKINLREMKNGSKAVIFGAAIKTGEIKHSKDACSIAYRIQYNGKIAVYTGDTDYCNEVMQIAKNADLLIAECTFPDKQRTEGHLTPSLAGKIAAIANVKQLVLTHLSPYVLNTDIIKACRKEFSGKITIAKDKMPIKI